MIKNLLIVLLYNKYTFRKNIYKIYIEFVLQEQKLTTGMKLN